MKRCILHLGVPKTASTSIQRTLLINRELLEAQGWMFPVFTCPEHGHEFFPHNDPLSRLFFPTHPFHVKRPINEGRINLQKQQEGLKKSLDYYCYSSENIILSSEVLLNPSALRKIKAYMIDQGYSVEPIVYVRSPYAYRVSLYQSFLKFSQQPAATIFEILRRPVIEQELSAVMKVFGKEATFFSFSHLVRNGHDIVKHFLTHLCLEEVLPQFEIIHENDSLSMEATALLEYIEAQCPTYVNNIKNRKRSRGDIEPLHGVIGEKFRFSNQQTVELAAIVEQDNRWLAKNLGKEYCDINYKNQGNQARVVWRWETCKTLLEAFPELQIYIQLLVEKYIRTKACFSSFSLKWFMVARINILLIQKIVVMAYNRIR